MSGADICVGERVVVRLLQRFGGSSETNRPTWFSAARLPVEDLISHRFPLNQIQAGIELALHPEPENR